MNSTGTMRRVVVVGPPGAGKTRMAGRIAALLGVPPTELDALHWQAGWRPAATTTLRAQVALLLEAPSWVVDGNYLGQVGDLTIGAADTVVWLDYALGVVLWRLFWRSLRRALAQEQLWNGNSESLRGQFLSRDSLLLWSLRNHRRTHRRLAERLAPYMLEAGPSGLRVVWCRCPREAESWLMALGAGEQQTPR